MSISSRAEINDRLEHIENLVKTDVLAAAKGVVELASDGIDVQSRFGTLAGSPYPLIIAKTRKKMEEVWGRPEREVPEKLIRYYHYGMDELIGLALQDHDAFLKACDQLRSDLAYRMDQEDVVWVMSYDSTEMVSIHRTPEQMREWVAGNQTGSVTDSYTSTPITAELNKLIGWNIGVVIDGRSII